MMYSKNLYSCILLLAIFLCPKAHGETPKFNSVVEKRGSTLFISGRIDENVDSKFKELFSNEINKIVVNSSGGEGTIAIKLANVVSRRRIKLVVRGRCISACTYIFLAAQSKVIERGSIFGIHGTFNAMDFNNVRSELEKGFLQSEKDDQAVKVMVESARVSFNKVREDGINSQSLLAKTMGFDEKIFEVTAQPDFPPKLREGVKSVIWWPSHRLLRKCFKVKNVRDYARPSDEALSAYAESMGFSNKSLQLIGDEVNLACKGGKPNTSFAPL